MIEQKIIGSCLLYDESLQLAVEKLRPSDFFEYRLCFEWLQELHEIGESDKDLRMSMKHRMEKNGFDFHSVIQNVPSSVTELVRQTVDIRIDSELRSIGEKLSKDNISECIQELAGLMDESEKKEKTMAEIMNEAVDSIKKAKEGTPEGHLTGLDIDEKLQGFKDGHFYILAGRPSHGKTALAMQIATEISKGNPVGFLSLETTGRSLGMRSLASATGIDGHKLSGGYVSGPDMYRIEEKAKHLAKLKLIVDDSTDLSSESLYSKANYLKRKHDISFLMIDYVQLMQSNGYNREQEVANVSRACVGVAKKLNIPVLGLAQLSRKNELRTDKRPILSDLRESGQLEQDAFAVIFIHRPEKYGDESKKGIAEIIVAKHKDGPTGIKALHFNEPTLKFSNLAKNESPF